MATKGETMMGAAGRVGVAVALVALVGCSSGAVRHDSSSRATTTTPVTAAAGGPPSTALNGAQGLAVPFTADNGALVITAGPPPDDVTAQQAADRAARLRTSAGRAPIVTVLSGRVTLAAGLGPTAIVDQPAWIVGYIQEYVAACPGRPAGAIEPTVPPSASHLTAIIITGATAVVGYFGAGTGICTLRSEPEVASEDDLVNGGL
jgi:hypothetical protein